MSTSTTEEDKGQGGDFIRMTKEAKKKLQEDGLELAFSLIAAAIGDLKDRLITGLNLDEEQYDFVPDDVIMTLIKEHDLEYHHHRIYWLSFV